MSQFQVMGDYLLVKQDESEKVTQSGIILSDGAQEPAQIGTVIAVGTGRRRESFELDGDGKSVRRVITRTPLEVQVGQRILFPRYAGMEVDEYLMLREDQILAILEEEEHDA